MTFAQAAQQSLTYKDFLNTVIVRDCAGMRAIWKTYGNGKQVSQ